MLVASLREVIRNQSQEIETLQNRLKEASSASGNEVRVYGMRFGYLVISDFLSISI